MRNRRKTFVWFSVIVIVLGTLNKTVTVHKLVLDATGRVEYANKDFDKFAAVTDKEDERQGPPPLALHSSKQQNLVQRMTGSNATLKRVASTNETEIDKISSTGTINSTADAPNDTAVEEKKPVFVIHIGPPKTGTTSLQRQLSEYRSTLREDNFIYLVQPEEEKNKTQFGWCLSRKANFANVTALNLQYHKVRWWNECWRFFEECRTKGINLLYSGEPVSILASLFEQEDFLAMQERLSDWDVRIVISYRRYFQWLYSSKFQMDQPSSAKRKLNMWPKKGGLPPLSIIKHMRQFLNGRSAYPYTFDLNKRFSKYFTVAIHNIHLEPSSGATFLCDVVPNATRSCQRSLQESTTFRENPSHTMYYMYDMMAVEARERKMANTTLKRPVIARKALEFHQGVLNSSEFELICPPEDKLQPFLNASLGYEKSLVPDFFASPKGEVDHIESFQKYVTSRKFCSIDVDKALADERWIEFFRTLG